MSQNKLKKAAIGRTIVATDHNDIAKAVAEYGHEYIITRGDHKSGSDRIYEALMRIDPEQRYNAILNIQGDLPTIMPREIIHVLRPLENSFTDIATLGLKSLRKMKKRSQCCQSHWNTAFSKSPSCSLFHSCYSSLWRGSSLSSYWNIRLSARST